MQFIASLWEGWGEVKQVVENQPETTPLAANPAAELVKSSPVSLTDRVNRFLQSAYDFRYNLLTEETDRKSTRLNSSHQPQSRMPSSA